MATRLVRHFFEMVAAMLVGMFVGGMIASGVCAAVGHSGFFLHHAGLRAPLMAFNMSIGMVVWMRYRGHAWTPVAEMVGAMCVPFLLLIGPYALGAISSGALLVGMHVPMLPAMGYVIYRRRDEYGADHTAHRLSSARA